MPVTSLPSLPGAQPQSPGPQVLPQPYGTSGPLIPGRPLAVVSTIIDAVLERLGQVPAKPAFWTRGEVMNWIWEGLVELQLISEQVQIETTEPLGNNSITGVPAGIAVIAVRNGNQSLLRYTIDELDGRYPTWENDPARPYPKGWSPFGSDKVITHPRSSRSDQTLTFVQLQLPDLLTETTALSLDAEYVESLVEYAEHVARIKEGGAEFQQSMENYKRFLKWAALLASRAKWKNAPSWILAPATKATSQNPRKLVEG